MHMTIIVTGNICQSGFLYNILDEAYSAGTGICFLPLSEDGAPGEEQMLLEFAGAADSAVLLCRTFSSQAYLEKIHKLLEAHCNVQSVEEEKLSGRFPLHHEDLTALRKRIYAHPERDWSLAACSEQLSLSCSYFHRIYKDTFGVSCAADIRRSRMEHARHLLLHTSDTLQEIARKCGYDYSHFMRIFRQDAGITPTEFRRRNK